MKTAAADTPAGKYIWQTRLYSTGGGRTGVNILDESGAYSWFAQPANYKTVVLKPADQGGSIWTFEKTDFTVGINEVRAAAAKASGQAHDLLGRPVGKDAHGIVIESDGSKRVR